MKQVTQLLTMQLGPNDVLLNMNIELSDRVSLEEARVILKTLEEKIKNTHQEVRNIFIEINF